MCLVPAEGVVELFTLGDLCCKSLLQLCFHTLFQTLLLTKASLFSYRLAVLKKLSSMPGTDLLMFGRPSFLVTLVCVLRTGLYQAVSAYCW